MANIIKKDISHWEILFEGLPDSAIPFISIMPFFFTDETNDMPSAILNYNFNYFWEKVDNINYKLYLRITGTLKDSNDNNLNLYVNVSAYFLNKNNLNSVQHNLGY